MAVIEAKDGSGTARRRTGLRWRDTGAVQPRLRPPREPSDLEIRLPIQPRRVLMVMLGIAAALTLMTIAIRVAVPFDSRSPDSPYLSLLALPDSTAEQSLANWYSSLAMVGCAVLMALIGVGRRARGERYAAHWIGLSVVFVVLALDEGIGFHDALAQPIGEAFELGGVFLWGWTIPWGILALACAFTYARFLAQLAPGVRGPIVAAASVYVLSALGLEMAEGQAYSQGGQAFPFDALTILEEFGEMAALALLAYGLLRQLAGNRRAAVRIGLEAQPARPISPPPAPARGRRLRRSSARSTFP